MALSPLALFFLLFAVPSSVLAILAARAFHLRALEPGLGKVRRASRLLLAAGLLPLAMVGLTVAATQGAPFVSPGGWVFVGYGVACAALGVGGLRLLRRAAADPRRSVVRAAETVPMVIVMLDLVFAVNALTQLPG
ncbi:MAG TPA: hypothetical protein VGR28_15405 [Candidatus Thermoplasmatota archaeon]|nr:hypothetical protein [Candidatus Thermoplasmatota archaeon]